MHILQILGSTWCACYSALPRKHRSIDRGVGGVGVIDVRYCHCAVTQYSVWLHPLYSPTFSLPSRSIRSQHSVPVRGCLQYIAWHGYSRLYPSLTPVIHSCSTLWEPLLQSCDCSFSVTVQKVPCDVVILHIDSRYLRVADI